jgi:hypothetical protein
MNLPEASASASGAGALAGIKVLDFGQMVSAPFCAKLFSDYGEDEAVARWQQKLEAKREKKAELKKET